MSIKNNSKELAQKLQKGFRFMSKQEQSDGKQIHLFLRVSKPNPITRFQSLLTLNNMKGGLLISCLVCSPTGFTNLVHMELINQNLDWNLKPSLILFLIAEC